MFRIVVRLTRLEGLHQLLQTAPSIPDSLVGRQAGSHLTGVGEASGGQVSLAQARWRGVPGHLVDNRRDMARRIPRAWLITYPGVGHVPMEEIPEIIVADVAEFLQEGGGQ